jgi:hypothetical protein
MVGQTFDLLGHAIASQRLEGLNDVGMQQPSPLLEQTAISNLVRESVLESVFMLREEPRLISVRYAGVYDKGARCGAVASEKAAGDVAADATCTQDLPYPGSILGGKLGLRGELVQSNAHAQPPRFPAVGCSGWLGGCGHDGLNTRSSIVSVTGDGTRLLLAASSSAV